MLSKVRTRWLAVAGLLAAAIAFGLIVASGGDADDADEGQGAAPTAPLERRDLAERVGVDGALGYADESEVINRISGTVTWLPQEGAVIRRGARLFEIDDSPVVLMYGDLPAYRDLAAGSSGADVKALEANLVELGFDEGGSLTIDDEFTSATAAAVADWQESLGLEQTGVVELGRVVFQRGPRRVSSLDLALGSDGGSAAGGADVGVSTGAQAVQTTLVAYEAPTDESEDVEKPNPPDDSEKPDGSEKPEGSGNGKGQGDRGQAKQPSAAAAAPEADTGSGAAVSGSSSPTESESSAVSVAVMTTTSVERVVTVELDPAEVSAAERGAGVRVTLPGGQETKGRIESVSTVAEAAAESSDEASSGSGTESATIEVTITLAGKAAASGLDQAPVDVELTEGVRRHVFAVPVEALIGTSGGEYAIVVVDGESRRRLEVDPGLFADGYVEIEGDGLSEGLAVEVPEQ